MKIAVLHDESAYGASLFEHLTACLSDHELITWHPAKPAPANDFQIPLGAEVDRKMLESQLISATTLASMKRGAILINVARGTLVDEAALTATLESGRIRAGGVDVLRNEPVDVGLPRSRTAHLRHAAHGGPTDLSIEGAARYVGTVIDAFASGWRWNSLLDDPPGPRRPLQDRAATAQPV
jgi:lactate dehydrogenase-like 2-hydroxyacid dehydrogenase